MNLTLGKFTPFNTIIHKLDSRIKLIALIVFMVSVFLSYGTPYMNLVIYGGIFVILLFISLLGRVSFLQLFKSLKGLWFMVLFIIVLNIFLPGKTSGDVAFSIGNVKVYYLTIINVSYILVRLILVMMMTNIFTSTTKPMEMTSALEWLFYPFKFIGLPIHKIAMAISLALRFIPTLAEETERIMKAQASRGVDFHQGKIKEKIKAIISLIIPLFMSAFLTSGELADAMEARGYDPDSKRTRYRAYNWGFNDTFGVILSAAFLAGMIVLAVYQYDLFNYLGISLPKLS
jgi:energy-coupling factor transport system permease protein